MSKKKEVENGNRFIQLNENVSKHFEKIDLDCVKLKYPLNKQKMEELYPNSYIVLDDELGKEMESFENVNKCLFFRGKFELELMQKIITDLRKKNKKGEYLSEKYDCVKIDPRVDTLTLLSRDADTPSELIKFLSRYKNTIS